MARPLLPLLCATVVLLLPWTAADTGDPALPLQTPSPELPTAPDTKTTTQKGTTDASPTSSPYLSPLPPATHGSSPETSTLLEMPTPLETSAPGEGTTPLFTAPPDHAAVSIQTLAYSIGLPLLVVVGVVSCCCWRMKMRARQDYVVAATAVPMVALAAKNEEMSPPNVFPTG
ncbi:hypothetical protein AV530_008576 [Patagioenas fasciata monilis]|uniref:Uncharacterized protein n=1 Tax=Patagioenas fasciata monilis TaxID=372326 RepID=A0A1V4JWA0_PATFA|nr:hypothetical protein AV530_008576 [Patagioenas fasciata monilis]